MKGLPWVGLHSNTIETFPGSVPLKAAQGGVLKVKNRDQSWICRNHLWVINTYIFWYTLIVVHSLRSGSGDQESGCQEKFSRCAVRRKVAQCTQLTRWSQGRSCTVQKSHSAKVGHNKFHNWQAGAQGFRLASHILWTHNNAIPAMLLSIVQRKIRFRIENYASLWTLKVIWSGSNKSWKWMVWPTIKRQRWGFI